MLLIILFLAQDTVSATEWALKIYCLMNESVNPSQACGQAKSVECRKVQMLKVEMSCGPATRGIMSRTEAALNSGHYSVGVWGSILDLNFSCFC